MNSIRLAASALLASVAVACSAVVIRHDKDDLLYRNLGANARYAPVGLINYTNPSATGTATGNYLGVGLDGKKWMVTAAHVVDNSIDSMSIALGGRTYQVEVSSLRWRTNWEEGKGDIGVGRILDPENTLTMAPARYWKGRIPVPANLGDHLVGTAVGFGTTGNGNTGATTSDQVKRGMQNRIDALDLQYNNGADTVYGYVSDFDNNTAAKNTLDRTDFAAANFNAGQVSDRTWLDLEGQLASGDSGGGLFADVGGQHLMIGIASAVTKLGSVASSTTHYGAYTTWAPFDDEWSGHVERWTGIQGVPEPGTMVALALGLAALARKRRPAATPKP